MSVKIPSLGVIILIIVIISAFGQGVYHFTQGNYGTGCFMTFVSWVGLVALVTKTGIP